MGVLADLFAVVLFLLVNGQLTDAVSCYNCTGLGRVADCDTIVSCNQDEVCYQEAISGSQYDLGCREKQRCQLPQGSIVGRRFLVSSTPSNCTECCDSDTCNRQLCLNVHGGWSAWSSWGQCSVTCGAGLQRRDRSCSNPDPDVHGDRCHGDAREDRICTARGCTDGGWSTWNTWSSCSATCGNGFKTRSRDCTNPTPTAYGKYCSGQPMDIVSCSNNRCPDITSSFSVTEPKSKVNTYLTFSTVIYNLGADFNSSTGIFTCSKPGVYMFTFILVKKRTDTRVDRVYCTLNKNTDNVILGLVDPTDDDTDKGNAYAGNTALIHLNKGDFVALFGCNDSPTSFMEPWTSFSGFLLYPDV